VDTAGRQRTPLGSAIDAIGLVESWKKRWKSQVISELSSWCSVVWNYWRVYTVYIYRCDLLESILLESIYIYEYDWGFEQAWRCFDLKMGYSNHKW
jgi:hypothetical protein